MGRLEVLWEVWLFWEMILGQNKTPDLMSYWWLLIIYYWLHLNLCKMICDLWIYLRVHFELSLSALWLLCYSCCLSSLLNRFLAELLYYILIYLCGRWVWDGIGNVGFDEFGERVLFRCSDCRKCLIFVGWNGVGGSVIFE